MLFVLLALFLVLLVCGGLFFAYDLGRRRALREATPGDVRRAWEKKIAKRSARKIAGVVAEKVGAKELAGFVEALERVILDEMQ